jgi:hypothetical protein
MLAVAACGGDDGGADGEEATDSTTPSTTSAPTTTLDEETRKEEAARAAYLAYHEAVLEAASDPVTPDLPELQQLTVGDQQRIVTRNLEDLQSRGQAVRPGNESLSSHQVRSAELQQDGSIVIVDCEVDDAIVYDIQTGRVIDDDVVTRLVEARMVREAGNWRLSLSTITEEWDGANECSG